MNERPRLTQIELTGTLALIRTIALTALPVLAVIAAIGYVMPAHQLGDEAFHSNYADGGVFSLIVLASAALGLYFLRTRNFGAGLGAGLIAIVASIAALAPVLLAHMFSHVHQGPGET